VPCNALIYDAGRAQRECTGASLASITAGSGKPAQCLGQFRVLRRPRRLRQVAGGGGRQSCSALLPLACGVGWWGGLNPNPAAPYRELLAGESRQEVGCRESETGCPGRSIGCQDQFPVIEGGMQAMTVEGRGKDAPDRRQELGVPPGGCDEARNRVTGTKVPGRMLDRSCHFLG
jgi:hypothetical protein